MLIKAETCLSLHNLDLTRNETFNWAIPFNDQAKAL